MPRLLLLKPKRGKTIAAREKSHQGKEPWLEEKPPQKARNSKIQNLIFPQTVLALRGSYFFSIVIALEIAKARRRPKYLSPAST